MAKQAGDFFIEGTIDDLTFYKMCGAYHVRMKSNLTGKRFWKDKAFASSRRSCERFARGNKIASKVYSLAAKKSKVKGLFSFLRKKSILLLKEGICENVIEEKLIDYLTDFGFIEREGQKKVVRDARGKCVFPSAIDLQTGTESINYLCSRNFTQNFELRIGPKRKLNQNYLSEYG